MIGQWPIDNRYLRGGGRDKLELGELYIGWCSFFVVVDGLFFANSYKPNIKQALFYLCPQNRLLRVFICGVYGNTIVYYLSYYLLYFSYFNLLRTWSIFKFLYCLESKQIFLLFINLLF